MKETGILKGGQFASISYKDKATGGTFYNVYDQSEIMRPVKLVQRIYWILLFVDAIFMIIF